MFINVLQICGAVVVIAITAAVVFGVAIGIFRGIKGNKK